MAEGARLESVFRLTPNEGSNPSLSAIFSEKPRFKPRGFFVWHDAIFTAVSYQLDNPANRVSSVGGEWNDALFALTERGRAVKLLGEEDLNGLDLNVRRISRLHRRASR